MDAPTIKITPAKVSQGAKIIENYVLGRTIGTGSFSRVHMGIHIQSGQKVAVKLMEKKKMTISDMRRTNREINILKRVFHSSIVKLYEIIETEKSLLLITEYLPNGELFSHIVSKEKLPEIQANAIFQQLFNVIDYLHSIGVAHRDLKPENILFDDEHTVKVIDFGLSNTYEVGGKLKTDCGSPCYAAPEMIKGDQKYHPVCVDIWSLGIILFAMLCGYLPFCDRDTAKLFNKILSGVFQFPPWVSNDAKHLISHMLTVNPNSRISLDDIKQHPWFKINSRMRNFGIDSFQCKIPVEPSIIQSIAQMPKITLSCKQIQEVVSTNTICKITAMYYLIAKKLTKDGYVLKSYICNKYFDESLLQKTNDKKMEIQTGVQTKPIQNISDKQPMPICLSEDNQVSLSRILKDLMTVELNHKNQQAMLIFYAFNLNNQRKQQNLKHSIKHRKNSNKLQRLSVKSSGIQSKSVKKRRMGSILKINPIQIRLEIVPDGQSKHYESKKKKSKSTSFCRLPKIY